MSDHHVRRLRGAVGWVDWHVGQTQLAPNAVSENLLDLNFLKLLWIPPYLSVPGESHDYCSLIKKKIFFF